MSNIEKQESIYTGGNLSLDVLELEDGTCVVISIDMIRVYDCREDFDAWYNNHQEQVNVLMVGYDEGSDDFCVNYIPA